MQTSSDPLESEQHPVSPRNSLECAPLSSDARTRSFLLSHSRAKSASPADRMSTAKGSAPATAAASSRAPIGAGARGAAKEGDAGMAAAASACASSAARSTPAAAAAASSSVAALSTPAAAAVTPAAETYDFGPFRPGQVASALLHYFAHRALRDTQARAISAILRGKDTFVLAPTGGGKSLCYMLPALLHAQQESGRIVVVVSPLIALMEDQISYLRSRGIRAAMLGSTVSAADKRMVFADIHAPLASASAAAVAAAAAAATPVDEDNCKSVEEEEREERWAAKQAPMFRPTPKPAAAPAAPAAPAQRLSLLFMSPELLSGSSGQEILSSLVSAGRVPFVAIDEVHCMSSWGHNFRPAFLKLAFLKRAHPAIPLMLLTATATAAVQKDVLSILGLQRSGVEMVRQSFNRPNVSYEVVNKEMIATLSNQSIYAHLKSEILKALGVQSKGGQQRGEEKDAAAEMETDENEAAAAAAMNAAAPAAGAPRPAAPAPVGQGSIIIYCSTRDSCATVAAELRKLSLSAAAYHAGLSTADRTAVQQAWMAGRTQIIAATNAFGMGINKSDVRAVVHFGLTCSSLEAYYQESGRCGRDGREALALVYYSQDEMRRQQYLAKLDNQPAGEDGGAEAKKVFRPGGSAGTVEHRLSLLEEMVRYCEATTCRRQVLLQYFGEMLPNSTPSLVAARKSGLCCDVCASPEKVQQSLALAKTLGVRGAGTASMAPLKSGFVFAGKKSGEADEYDYDDSAEPAEGEAESALSHKRKRADPEDEESESRVSIPKHILMDKSSNSLHSIMDHLEAAEARSNRAQGIDRSVKRVPFASLKTPATASASAKRRGPAYKGPLLDVDGAHSIKDLPLPKREQCFARLSPAVAANVPFSSASTSSSSSGDHPPERIAVALEFQVFASNHSSAGYLASMRTLLQNLAAATKNAKELAEVRTIDWEKIPLRVEDSTSSSSSSDDGSSDGSSSSDDDDDGAPPKSKVSRTAATTATTGGFISAASLVSKPSVAPSSSSSARSKLGGALGFAPASSLPGSSIAAAGIAGAKRSNPAAASQASVARAVQSIAQVQKQSIAAAGGFKKPGVGAQAPFKKPAAVSSSAAVASGSNGSAAPKLLSFFTASSPSTRPSLPSAPSPPRSSSSSSAAVGSSGSGQKFKFHTALPLSWAHPVGGAKTSATSTAAAGAGASKASSSSGSAAAPPPPSPSRIQPLTLTTTTGTPPKSSAAASGAEDRSAKRPRLDLTTTP